MAKIKRSKECGNSPKNKLIENCAIHLLTANSKALMPLLSDDVVWEPVGRNSLQGKAALTKRMAAKNFPATTELQIEHVGSHGRTGFVNGEMLIKSGKRLGFCVVAQFANSKGDVVDQLTTYLVVAT